jgi:ribonucleoside-triphosphate reductase
MKIEEISRQLETTNRIEYEGKCHDCEKDVKVCIFKDDKEAIVIQGGAVYNPVINDTKQIFFKCDNCFQKDSVLRNWQPVETYSRIVGYLRPVSGWNKGKREEFKQRKEFVIGEEKVK